MMVSIGAGAGTTLVVHSLEAAMMMAGAKANTMTQRWSMQEAHGLRPVRRHRRSKEDVKSTKLRKEIHLD
jgi:hypothetical protein